jgi:TolB protein
MAANGGDQRRLTNTPDFDTEPAWSPNGITIAFRRSTTGAGSDIALILAAGGTVQRLTLAGEQRLPVWSPDGQRIVFVNQASTTSRPDIYSMHPDASELRPLVADVVPGGSVAPAFLRRRPM